MLLESIGTPILWVGFTVFIIIMLALDLGVFHRGSQITTIKESLIWTGIWIIASLLFNFLVWHWFGRALAIEFFTSYLIEKSLSVDNIFIFLIIFNYFKVPAVLQHRVLFWGILGALVMRAVFIWLGAVLLQKFSWIIYPFGLILLWTGAKLIFKPVAQADPERSWIVRLFKYFMPVTPDFVGGAFFVRQNQKIFATPLLLVLVAIESTDLVFAFDSIPAVFAVTKDPFIVYTSNIFALLGLRSLYFALAGIMERFYYLRYGLAVILLFVGLKMLGSSLFHVPTVVSLLIIVVILIIAVIASWLKARRKSPN
jgi:tellurite resistance protein TerC